MHGGRGGASAAGSHRHGRHVARGKRYNVISQWSAYLDSVPEVLQHLSGLVLHSTAKYYQLEAVVALISLIE